MRATGKVPVNAAGTVIILPFFKNTSFLPIAFSSAPLDGVMREEPFIVNVPSATYTPPPPL